MRKGDAVQLLAVDIIALGLPAPEREFRFAPPRRYRFDFAWPAQEVAIEVDGGTWTGGRHTSGVGFANDCRKLNLATLRGWRVYRFTTTMVRDGEATDVLAQVLA